MEITSSSPEVGEASEVIPVEYEDQPTVISFNATYILDFLGVVKTDSVSLDFKDDVSQAVLTPVDPDGCAYTYVIMPMRI